jgi:hypothetical protein
MVKYMIAPLILLLSISGALAQTMEYCSDNTTLTQIKQVTINVPERNVTRTINVTENVKCDWGCDPERNRCNDAPYIYILIIMGVIVISFVAFKYFIIPMVR